MLDVSGTCRRVESSRWLSLIGPRSMSDSEQRSGPLASTKHQILSSHRTGLKLVRERRFLLDLPVPRDH